MSANGVRAAGGPDAAPAGPPAGPAARIEVERLGVRYPAASRDALADVSLAVRAGERQGVAGRTGAGKSTLALSAAGFIPRVVRARTRGRVAVAGVDALASDASALLGRVGIVFSTPANQLSASKPTVREELAFGLENLGVARRDMDPRIDAVLGRLGISHLAERDPFALSGGEQQRVAIAAIVAMGSDALVLDEPTAQLDPAGTVAVADLIDELAREGVAVLCAEHDPAVLGRMDRVVVLHEGAVVTDAPPGTALGEASREVLGAEPPTLVRLAAAAGLPPAAAFDEAAIVDALRSAGRRLALGDARASDGEQAVAWSGRGAPPAGVEVADLTHRYPGGVEALRGVSLRIEPGERVAIVGQNGSGKTTLAKHLNGLLRPDSGRVRVGELDAGVEAVHRLASVVGFVFQNPDDQLFERSVEREVAFGPRTMGLRDGALDALVDEAIAAVGLAGSRSTNPYDLDLSQRKLVGLASVLATDPSVVVLDEPTTGQDGPGLRRLGSIIDGLAAAGRTVVAISHDMEFAAGHFARIVVLRRGEVVLDGPPGAVFAPANRELLASTGLTPPPAARLAAALGLRVVPLDGAALLDALAAGPDREAAGPAPS